MFKSGVFGMTKKVKDIINYAKKKFGTDPEYLWKNDNDSAVFRNRFNKKWYAIIMKVRKESLNIEGTGKVWVINVKCDPVMVGSFINRQGFLPAYHMNKEHWMSILVDSDEVSIDEILNILNISYEIVDKSTKRNK